MDNRSTGLFNDSRINLRVEDNCDILWKGRDGKIGGRGKVRNISTSGMLIETKTDCVPDNESILYFNPITKNGSYIPKESRLVWRRKKRFSNKYEYGIKFIEPSENILSNLRQKVQKGIHRFTKIRRLEMIFNVLLVAIILGLTCYAMWVNTTVMDNIYASNHKLSFSMAKQTALTNNYSELYKSTDIALRNSEANLAKVMTKLDATTEQLATTTDELNRVTKLYKDGKEMLNSVNSELVQTRKLLANTKAMMAQNNVRFANDINSLNAKNEELTKEMYALQEKLSYYEGDVKNLKEGSDLISLYRVKMKLVKSKIKIFKREAEVVRKAAMVETDRIKMIIGNNGYLVKGGKIINTDMDKFHSVSLDASQISGIPKTGKVKVMIVE